MIITKHIAMSGDDVVGKYRDMGIDYAKFFKMDNLSKLGYVACYDLLRGEKFGEHNESIALVMCCRSSSIDTDIMFEKTIIDNNAYFPSPSIFVYTLPNIVLGEIAIAFDVRGENCCYLASDIEHADFATKVEQLFAHTPTKTVIGCWLEYFDQRKEALFFKVERCDTGLEFNNQNIIKLYYDGKFNQ